MGYWGIDWPDWFPSGRTDYSGATHQDIINAIGQLRSSQGNRGSTISVGGSSGNDVQWGNRRVVIDLAHGVASVFVTRYVPKYSTKVVSRYATRFRRVITALTVNYLLNGQVVTQVVIPTRIVMQESTSGGQQGASATVTTRRRRTIVKTVPGKNIPAKLIV